MTLPGRENRVQWALSSKTNEEVAEGYGTWAGEYDADLQSYGYRSPAIVAGIVGRHVPLDSLPIMDAGAGTGIMGEVLNTLGYKEITALDLSKGMLEVAARKEVYADIRQMALGESLDFPTDHFAAIVCIGTFAAGHVTCPQ